MFRGYLSKYFMVELTSYLYKINKKKVDKIEIKKECRKKRIYAFFIDKQTTRNSKSTNTHTDSKFLIVFTIYKNHFSP